MLIELSELSQAEGKEIEVSVSYEPDVFEIGSEAYRIADKDCATFKLSCPHKGSVHIEGIYSIKAEVPCDRCLTDVTVPVTVSISEDIDALVDEPELNVDELLYKEILMEWPSKILCHDDCKGLCVKCGRNQNFDACDCDKAVLDPRMAAILDVFNNSKN